jgi:sulfur carrier protein
MWQCVRNELALPTMNINVNGQKRAISANSTIAELLSELGLESRHVAVEVNLEIVPRGKHAEHRLAEGDRLEVVTLVGGG